MGGIEAGGWRIVRKETVPEYLDAAQAVKKLLDLKFSLGMTVQDDDSSNEHGTIIDVVPGLPAANAGIAPGMKLISVNGRSWTAARLHQAIAAAKGTATPIELQVDNTGFIRNYRLDYHEGERYPWLERDTSRADLLSEILKPRTPTQ